MRYFKIMAEDGQPYLEGIEAEPEAVITIADIPGYGDNASIICEVDRPPTEFEIIEDDGSLVEDVARREDTLAGATHIAQAHAIKAVEASLILSGVKLTHGLLAQEALALGVTIEELAGQVSEKTEPLYLTEVGRRSRKSQA